MTPRDYKLIAQVLKGALLTAQVSHGNAGAAAVRTTTIQLTDALQDAYENFDRVKFINATGALEEMEP